MGKNMKRYFLSLLSLDRENIVFHSLCVRTCTFSGLQQPLKALEKGTLPSRGKEEEKETARMCRLCELGHLHKQGARGERGRLVMAREGKDIPECHKQRWTVRVQGQGAAGIGQHISIAPAPGPFLYCWKCCGGQRPVRTSSLAQVWAPSSSAWGERQKYWYHVNPTLGK